MSAGKAIEMLKDVGIQEVSRRTHISPENVRKLLNEEFESFSSVQFNGFMTIIEREFDVGLEEWRMQFAQSNPEPEEPLAASEDDPFAKAARAKREQRMTAAVLVLLLMAVIVVTYVVLGNGEKKEKFELNNTAIEQAKANIAALNASVSDTRAQADALQDAHQREGGEGDGPNPQEAAPEAVTLSETPVTIDAAALYGAEPQEQEAAYGDVILEPNKTIWVGVIDAANFKRSAYTTSDTVHLEGSKKWLIITGHGLFSIMCGGKEQKFSTLKRVLLLYEGGSCREVDAAEFRARNKGKIW